MSQEELIEQIEALQREITQLKQQTVFSDIQPYIEENEHKFKKLIISNVGLEYLVKFNKPGILKQIRERVANDLMQELENIQLLDPVKGTLLTYNEDFQQFEQDGVYHLDFQYATSSSSCDHQHGHSHSHSIDGDDDDDDFTDDENFYNSCSCSHP